MEPDPHKLGAKFRPLIEAELVDLRQQSAATDDDRRPVELDQQSVGRLSRMDALQMQAMAKAIEQRRKARVVALEQALRRMADDEYGFCANCGEFIGERRLEIDPATPKCVKCA
jgi:DnaK suppressor protein